MVASAYTPKYWGRSASTKAYKNRRACVWGTNRQQGMVVHFKPGRRYARFKYGYIASLPKTKDEPLKVQLEDGRVVVVTRKDLELPYL